MQLRAYQQEAVDAVWGALREGHDPVLELPTGSGKSLVGAELARRTHEKKGRILIATHVQELVAQNAAEFQRLTNIEPGILCAGLERTDKGHDVLFASVQSLYGPVGRGEIEPFDAILVDECHLVASPDSDAKFYPSLFEAFPDARRIGMSATPYRLGDGPVYGNGKYFTQLAYSVPVTRLITEGYLSPISGLSGSISLNRDKLRIVAGEFDVKSVEEQESDDWLRDVVAVVNAQTAERRHIAVFAPSVAVAHRVAALFVESGSPAGVVVGDSSDRMETLADWASGVLRIVCSVNVLTTGFNLPALDCIVCIRPTQSQGLWVQLLGRGMRRAPGKTDCLLLDFSGNLEMHGGVCVGMPEYKKQKKNGEVVVVEAAPSERIETRLKIITNAKDLMEIDPTVARPRGIVLAVREVKYKVVPSPRYSGKNILLASYVGEMRNGRRVRVSQFCCVEYAGFPRDIAERWFVRRGVSRDRVPLRATSAIHLAYGLPVPHQLRVRKSGMHLNVEEEIF